MYIQKRLLLAEKNTKLSIAEEAMKGDITVIK